MQGLESLTDFAMIRAWRRHEPALPFWIVAMSALYALAVGPESVFLMVAVGAVAVRGVLVLYTSQLNRRWQTDSPADCLAALAKVNKLKTATTIGLFGGLIGHLASLVYSMS